MCRPSACAVNEQASLVWVSVYESSTLTRASVGELRPLIEGALAAIWQAISISCLDQQELGGPSLTVVLLPLVPALADEAKIVALERHLWWTLWDLFHNAILRIVFVRAVW